MGLLGRIIQSLYAQASSANERSQLRLELSFRHGNLRFDFRSSARPDDAERSPTADETRPVRPSEAPGTPRQAPDPGASIYSVPRQRQIKTEGPHRRNSASISFWDALEPTEREVLRSVASLRTFAAGATIMQEGDRADHVIVILGGKAIICVNENGKQRVVAERGLGQLVGERGALQVSVRSATVIALEMVWALVVQTRDFAVFVSAYPRVRALVQEQRYDRGTDEPTGYEYDRDDQANFGIGLGSRMVPGQPGGFIGENCTVILTDVVAFSARMRNDRDRLIIRSALSSMANAAMQGIPDVWSEDRGDGMLMVIPPDVPTARVMDQLLQELPGALDRHNRNHDEPASFQLRLAINVGPVVSDTMGVSGEAIIVAARLVEASGFKEALAGSTASLGVIVSPFVYEAVIRHAKDPGYVASYSAVPVEVKESRTTAWMKLFDTPLLDSLVSHHSAHA